MNRQVAMQERKPVAVHEPSHQFLRKPSNQSLYQARDLPRMLQSRDPLIDAVKIRSEHKLASASQRAYMLDMLHNVVNGGLAAILHEPRDERYTDASVPPDNLSDLPVVQVSRMSAHGSCIGMRRHERLGLSRRQIPERRLGQMGRIQ